MINKHMSRSDQIYQNWNIQKWHGKYGCFGNGPDNSHKRFMRWMYCVLGSEAIVEAVFLSHGNPLACGAIGSVAAMRNSVVVPVVWCGSSLGLAYRSEEDIVYSVAPHQGVMEGML